MKIEVTLTKEEYRRFFIFDYLIRRKLWRSPALFAAILGVSAVICFCMGHVDGSAFLGSVLLVVGLGVPLVYFINFFNTLRLQIKTYKLPRTVYTLELTNDKNGIKVYNDSEKVEYAWSKIYHVYRNKTASYLFITQSRGFVIPHYFVPGGADALWQLLERCVSAEKLTPLK